MSNAQTSKPTSALRKLFDTHGKQLRIAKRNVITPYLELPRCLYLVTKGSLRVLLNNPDSDGVVCVGHLKPGDIFGEQGLFDSAPMALATASVHARSEVELLSITHTELKRAAQPIPALYAELSAHINERLGQTTAKLLQLVFDPVERRCYQSLIEVTALPDSLTHPNGMQISLTRIELAQMCGCNRETAGRVLRVLEDKGLIEANGSRIVVFGYRHGVPVTLRSPAEVA